MQLFLAIYDPASKSDYWICRHEQIPLEILNKFYYEIALSYKPDYIERLGIDDIYAGFATVDNTWCCWYRFFNGGRDSYGRPGRFVIACAFILREKIVNKNMASILECPEFYKLAQTVVNTSFSLPSPLSIQLKSLPIINFDSNEIKKNKSVFFEGADAFLKAAETIAFLVKDNFCYAIMEQNQGNIRAQIDFSLPISQKSSIEKILIDNNDLPEKNFYMSYLTKQVKDMSIHFVLKIILIFTFFSCVIFSIWNQKNKAFFFAESIQNDQGQPDEKTRQERNNLSMKEKKTKNTIRESSDKAKTENEKIAFQQGKMEGSLEIKFGEEGLVLMEKICNILDMKKLKELQDKIKKENNIKEIKQFLENLQKE